MKSKKKISKKKKMSRFNFSNMWPRSLDCKHYRWRKNWSLISNQLNIDGWNRKKKSITQKD
jgi:hypothetical protein